MNQLLTIWSVDLLSVLMLAGLSAFYGWVVGWQLKPGAGLYVAGLLLVAIVQTSPLHVLGMHYLLSAHMVGHMVLLLVAAPLLVLGLPKKAVAGAATFLTAVSVFFRKRPWSGWLVCLVTMWFWHVPTVHDAMMSPPIAGHEIDVIPLCTLTGTGTTPLINALHIIQPISLLLAGVCFAWPILGPLWSHRIHPLTGVLYLFTACVGCSLLGMLITFAPVGMYQTYGGPDYTGIANQLKTNWGFNPATDQQTAGLLMWVPGCFVYLSGAMYLVMNWLGKEELVTDY